MLRNISIGAADLARGIGRAYYLEASREVSPSRYHPPP